MPHAQELLQRVIEHKPLDEGTRAEALVAISDTSLRAPLASEYAALAEKLFLETFGPDAIGGPKPPMFHEPWHGASEEFVERTATADSSAVAPTDTEEAIMIELFEAFGPMELLGWVGSVLAMIGTLLLALNCDSSRYGFACNLLASACLVGYAAWNNILPMLALNAVMVVVSIVGLLRWFGPHWRLKRWQRIDFSGRRFERMLANARAKQGL